MKSAIPLVINCFICTLALSLVASCTPNTNNHLSIPATSQIASTPSPESNKQLPLVETNGQSFIVNGENYRFIGANTIYFGFYEQYGLSIDDAIRSAKQNGISVIRIYLGLGTGPWGARPMEEYDRVLDVAARYDMYVIATLTDCCCVGTDWGPTLETYFKEVPYCHLAERSGFDAFKVYIENILTRKNSVNGKIYRDDTTIFAWDIANEPMLQNFSTSEVSNYLSGIISYVKSIDSYHLATIGVDASSSQYSTEGVHYDVLNVPGLDFFSFHYNLSSYNVVSQHLDALRFRVEKFASMGKPVVLEEFGVGSQRILVSEVDPSVLTAWVDSYRLQMDTAFSSGASGVMFWGWGVPETRNVPLWWRVEDHDITEDKFCQLIREYQLPQKP